MVGRSSLAVAATFTLAAIVGAMPQDALGTGRGLEHRSGSGSTLDRNLQHGSGGRNTPSAQENLRARNLVVTGNVAGGRGFRGNVNYTAEQDFRGASSDDTSYSFRADSAFSDPRLARAGSMGDRLGVARSYANIEYGRSTISSSLLGNDPISARQRFDQSATRLTGPDARRGLSDLSTAAVYDVGEGERVRMQTGGFAGVRSVRQSDAIDALELGLYESSRLKQDLRQGRLDKELEALDYKDPLRIDTMQEAPTPADGSDARISANRLDTGIQTMDSIVKALDRNLEKSDFGMNEPGTPDANGRTPTGAARSGTVPSPSERMADFAQELERLRSEIRGTTRAPERPEEDPFSLDRRTAPAAGEAADPKAKPEGADGAAADKTARAEQRRRAVEDLAVFLKHGERVETLSDSQVERVREIIGVGEQAMARGAFFLAEQHFDTALTLNPGNPLAQAGIAHAQLGAGLTASAAITLRGLYADHPELIDARFAPGLLPSVDRMKALREALGVTSTDARNAADVGLVLAYLGRQLDDRDAIERGLAMMKGAPGDEVLARLLKSVWLDAPAPAAAPAAVPAAAPAAGG